MTSPLPLNCDLASICSGCPLIGTPYEDQVQDKKLGLQASLTQIFGANTPGLEFVEAPPWRSRDKADLTLIQKDSKTRLGLFSQTEGDIVDMSNCPQMSEKLESWLIEFRSNLPKVKKGSVRLRVSPSGQRGLWLDFANQDVKDLFDERSQLEKLSKLAVIEIGQRLKRLEVQPERLKLLDPKPELWFQTFDLQKPMDLYSHIGSFTQAGFKVNRLLLHKVLQITKSLDVETALELFCGIGNFTLPLASLGLKVRALELEVLSLNCLEQSLTLHKLTDQVQIERGDLYRLDLKTLMTQTPLVLVDPPRSGLKGVLNELAAVPLNERPQHWIYISCFQESFLEDLKILKDLGYQLDSVAGVDQFPQSHHCEWVGHLVKTN